MRAARSPIKPPIANRVLALIVAVTCAIVVTGSTSLQAEASRSLLKSAKSWAYQLQGNPFALVSSHADIVVIDADHMRAAVGRLKTKPGGARRLVIGYVAIGEAEVGRPYWSRCCAKSRPHWLTNRTQGWAGNYIVQYWDPAWKAIVRERVRMMMAAGFDGLYLDRVDTWENIKGGPGGSREAMIQWVREVSAYAKSLNANAVIIVQNGEELLTSEAYLAAIDAIAKEDLFHGVNHDGKRNEAGMVAESVRLLKRAQARGKTILVIEYLSGSTAENVRAEIRRQGFVPFFGGRSLTQ